MGPRGAQVSGLSDFSLSHVQQPSTVIAPRIRDSSWTHGPQRLKPQRVAQPDGTTESRALPVRHALGTLLWAVGKSAQGHPRREPANSFALQRFHLQSGFDSGAWVQIVPQGVADKVEAQDGEHHGECREEY